MCFGHRRPPVPCGVVANERARHTHFATPLRPGRDPEEALGPHHIRPGLVEEVVQLRWLERRRCPIDEAVNAILIRLWDVVLEAVKFLEPERMTVRLLKIETPGCQYRV